MQRQRQRQMHMTKEWLLYLPAQKLHFNKNCLFIFKMKILFLLKNDRVCFNFVFHRLIVLMVLNLYPILNYSVIKIRWNPINFNNGTFSLVDKLYFLESCLIYVTKKGSHSFITIKTLQLFHHSYSLTKNIQQLMFFGINVMLHCTYICRWK